VLNKLNDQVKSREQLVQQLNRQKSTIEGLELQSTKLEQRHSLRQDQLKQTQSEQLKAVQIGKEELKTIKSEKDQMHKLLMSLKNKDAINLSELKKKDIEINKQNERIRKLLNEKDILNKNNKQIVD